MRPFLPSADELIGDFRRIIESGWLTKGPYLRQYEQRAAEVLGAPYAVGVSSCTTGLMLLLLGVERPGEVVLPSFTFMASALPVVWNGLTPVFVDCDERTFNVDPEAVEAAITDRTRAILATHVFGNPCDVDSLADIARRGGCRLFFDAAHGFGAELDGKPLGALGDGSAFSTTPTKLVITGEGGMVTTVHEDIARMVEIGREYGNPGDYNTVIVGLNGRLPEVSALIGLKTLEMLDENVWRRRHIAQLYRSLLEDVPGISFQVINPKGRSSYKDFAIVVDERRFGRTRDELADFLAARGVDTKKYFDPPVHMQKAFERWRPQGGLERTERLARRVLCLPIYAELSDEEVEYVCRCIREARG